MMGSFLLYFVLYVMVTTCSAAGKGYLPKSKPPYCNEHPENSAVQPLSPSEEAKVGSIVQVQTMIRHGSRTPWGKEPCWVNYNIPWSDCNVTELMIADQTQYNDNTQTVPEPWLFRKVYNAFPNVLGGMNCFTGQLLKEGYDQEQTNGNILNTAYLSNTNTNLNLFSSDKWADVDPNDCFFRSDDEQRTLMSGQTVLSTMFDLEPATGPNTIDSIVQWHTGDESIDQIAPNTDACPALNGIQTLSYASSEYLATNNSVEVTSLTDNLNDILGDWQDGYWNWFSIIDCFMTAVCNDYPIPPNPTTGAEVDDAMFNATIANVEYTYSYNMNYNNSRFAKTGMGHTIYEMRTRLEAAVNDEDDAIKYGLWSAHDTSIMPLLSALLEKDGVQLWDGKWAQYAAMVNIELYTSATEGQSKLFRMTYNGKPIRLPACLDNDDDLCDVNNLLDAMNYAQDQMPCDALPDDPSSSGDEGTPANVTSNDNDDMGLSGSNWVILSIVLSLVSGSVGVYVGMNCLNKGTQTGDVLLDDSSSASLHQNLVPARSSPNPIHNNEKRSGHVNI